MNFLSVTFNSLNPQENFEKYIPHLPHSPHGDISKHGSNYVQVHRNLEKSEEI